MPEGPTHHKLWLSQHRKQARYVTVGPKGGPATWTPGEEPGKTALA